VVVVAMCAGTPSGMLAIGCEWPCKCFVDELLEFFPNDRAVVYPMSLPEILETSAQCRVPLPLNLQTIPAEIPKILADKYPSTRVIWC